MEKVVFISQYFPPDMVGSGRVMQELAEGLSESGYDLKIIAGTSRYFNKKSYGEYTSGVNVERVWHFRFSNDSKIGQLLNFISFPLSLLVHLFSFRKANKVIVVSSPPTVILIGALINTLWGKKVYLILQDIYPDLAIHLGVLSERSFLVRGMRHLNRWSFKHIYKIVVLSDSMSTYLAKSYDLQTDKVMTISNWADTEKIYPAPKSNPWSQVSRYVDKFVVLYAGNIGLSYDFTPILDAAEQLKEYKDIVFLLVGEGKNKKMLQDQARARGLGNIDLMSYVAEEDYNKLLASADCQIVIHKQGMDPFNLPGKVCSYMASGRPIIALAQRKGELSRLLSSAKAGMDVGNARELTEAIKKLRADPQLAAKLGENGRKYTLKHYDRKLVIRKYLRLLK